MVAAIYKSHPPTLGKMSFFIRQVPTMGLSLIPVSYFEGGEREGAALFCIHIRATGSQVIHNKTQTAQVRIFRCIKSFSLLLFRVCNEQFSPGPLNFLSHIYNHIFYFTLSDS